MNPHQNPYKKFALSREMAETTDVVRKFDPSVVKPMVEGIRGMKALLLTGEGSSRIFPAKRAITRLRRRGVHFPVFTEGATQALEYPLGDVAVLGASNSGKTKEVVRLFHRLKGSGHRAFFGLASTAGTPVVDLAVRSAVLACGKEAAVAATKSVVEQALFIDALCHGVCGLEPVTGGADAVAEVLAMTPPNEVVGPLVKASKIYFAGRADGVAEELTLKTNEITRKKSAYLEGTYAAHGIEEVMDNTEVVVVVDPFPDEEEKYEEVLVKGVGISVVAIASRPTRFPTFRIPDGGALKEVVELCAGWNLLLETGLALGIDLDHPVRARKVGNEYQGG